MMRRQFLLLALAAAFEPARAANAAEGDVTVYKDPG
jgi:hypothetical protein